MRGGPRSTQGQAEVEQGSGQGSKEGGRHRGREARGCRMALYAGVMTVVYLEVYAG